MARLRGSGSWRSALRIAVRESLRHKGRTALIAGLIALPVLAMGFFAVLYRTQQLTPDERADREMGQTDAIAFVTGQTKALPPDPAWWSADWPVTGHGAGARSRDRATVDLAALLPAGSTLTPGPTMGSLTVRQHDRSVPARAVVDGLGDDERRGLFRQLEGRSPSSVDEVALSPSLADRLHVRIGDSVWLRGGKKSVADRQVQVVGYATDPSCLDCAQVYGVGNVLADLGVRGSLPATLVSLPGDADPHRLWSSLAAHGVVFMPRDAYRHDNRYSTSGSGDELPLELVATGSVIVGFGLLEVVLLAGAAFAVGAKRQVRELGLVGVAGGTRLDVRRIVLAQGLVLGFVGGIVGLAVGILTVWIGRPQWEKLAGHYFGGLVIRPIEVIGVAAFGVVAGLFAALMPSISASRLPIVAALADRFSRPRQPLRRPLIGVAVIATGVVLSFLSAVQVDAPSDRGGTSNIAFGYAAAVVAGFGLITLGILLATPALIAALGALGHRLPLIARLATRDADRHRHRTTPAIAAVSLAVAGTVAIGFVVAGNEESNRSSYLPELPVGAAMLSAPGNPRANDVIESAAKVLDADRLITIDRAISPGKNGSEIYVLIPLGQDSFAGNSVIVGDADVLTAVGGAAPTAAKRALAEGKLVVFQANAVTHGRARVDYNGKTHGIPAVGIDLHQSGYGTGGAIMSPDAAQRLGFRTKRTGTLLPASTPPSIPPSQDAEDRAAAIMDGVSGSVYVERGYQSHLSVVSAGLSGASGIVTIAGVAIAVGLAAAEGRADLATLGAIGAAPRRRRLLAMAQASVVGGVGCVVGTAFGLFIATVMLSGFKVQPWAVPWLLLVIVAVGVPLLAMLVAGVCTRSRLPMVRRLV